MPISSFAASTYPIDLEDGSSQYLSITDGSQSGLDLTGDFTLETWVYVETTSGVDYYFSKFNDDTNNASYRVYHAGADINLSISSNGSSWTTKSITTHPAEGEWYHFAVSYDASAGEAQFYINGVATEAVKTGLPTSVYDSTATFAIGANVAASVGGYIDGRFDETRVWNTARTADEIGDNYDCELVGNETGLVAYWKYENDLTDETANANNLTNNNSATFTGSVPTVGSCAGGGPAPETPVAWVNYQIMSTSTDAILGYTLELLFVIFSSAVITTIAYFIYKLTR